MFEIVIYILLGVGILLAGEGVFFFIRYATEKEREKLRHRLRRVGESGGTGLLRERRMARTPGLASVMRMFPFSRRMELLLIQTDLTWTVAQVLGMGMMAGLVLGVGLFVFMRSPLLGIVGLVLGIIAPISAALISRSRRNTALSQQVPDALDMMARSLRAGHGISSGFKLVATEMPSPIAVEFGRCFEEHNMGVDFRDAVEHMTERAPGNLDLKLFAVSLVIQAETGGNLAEVLEKIAETIRERFKFYGKLRAMTAEVKVSAMVISMTPFIFGGLITMSKPQYLLPLFQDPTGQMLLLLAVALWVVGWILLRTLSRVDY